MAELERLRVASTRDETVVLDRAADSRALELEAAERARVRGEISTMVSERPDEVAQMLRGWLSESGDASMNREAIHRGGPKGTPTTDDSAAQPLGYPTGGAT